MSGWVPTMPGARRRRFADGPDPERQSTFALVAAIRDDYARAVFTRLLGGAIARRLARAYRPEGVF
jgi:hypothetical protein